MADIFISYASEDREQAHQLAEALGRQDWSVWWDRTIPTGRRFSEVIDEELAAARCVIVLWSLISVKKDWVLEEADDGKERNILVPILIEDVRLPRGFRRIHAADMSEWDGTASHLTFQKLVNDIAGILGQPPAVVAEAKRKAALEAKRAKKEARRKAEERAERERREEAKRLKAKEEATKRAAALKAKQKEEQQRRTEEEAQRTAAAERLKEQEAASSQTTSPASPSRAFGTVFRDTLKGGGKGPEMVVIPAGSFVMGSPQGEGYKDEWPQHRVCVEAFSIGRYEVTFEEYDRFAEATGRNKPEDRGWGRGGRRPVIDVSWDDATAYAEWLSSQTGKRYRLPTEAEWEYAARAGTNTQYWWGDEIGTNRANCNGCGSKWDNKQTAPVGSFDANPFGLYDTSGNVREWVEDCWHGSYEDAPKDGSAWVESHGGNCSQRVLRGGSWGDIPDRERSAYRGGDRRGIRNNLVGFRVAQD